MGNKKNIIVGAAAVFIGGALDESTGDTDAAITAWKPAVAGTDKYGDTVAGTAGWRDVGYTTNGLEVATNPTWGDVAVDQLLDSAKIFKDGMTLALNTTFAEATLENLLVAWGQTDDTLTSSASENELDIDGGSLGEAPVERGLIAVGNAVEKSGNTSQYGERTYFAYRVLSVDPATHTLARSDATTIPVSFRSLPANNGKYGSVRDRLLS